MEISDTEWELRLSSRTGEVTWTGDSVEVRGLLRAEGGNFVKRKTTEMCEVTVAKQKTSERSSSRRQKRLWRVGTTAKQEWALDRGRCPYGDR